MPEWAGRWPAPGRNPHGAGVAGGRANQAGAPREPPAMPGGAVPCRKDSQDKGRGCLEAECHSLLIFVCIQIKDGAEDGVRDRAASCGAPASLLARLHHGRSGAGAQLFPFIYLEMGSTGAGSSPGYLVGTNPGGSCQAELQGTFPWGQKSDFWLRNSCWEKA